jgi:hypothetical protein
LAGFVELAQFLFEFGDGGIVPIDFGFQSVDFAGEFLDFAVDFLASHGLKIPTGV